MQNRASHWETLYGQTPILDAPRIFAGISQSAFMTDYLSAVLERTPRGERSLETGIGSGHGSIWLSLRGVLAEGIDNASGIVERAIQVNSLLGGAARFRGGNIFDLYSPGAPRYATIHHQGLLEHFTLPEVRAILAQQVALADYVVFSVPSVHYPFGGGEFGDERLLPLEVWEEAVAPFEVEQLCYYGDPQNGAREHVLGVLRGQPATNDLVAIMTAYRNSLPRGVTAVVLAMDEETNIGDCLRTLQWCDQAVCVVMDSHDKTEEIARSLGAHIIRHPVVKPFDRARNPGIFAAEYSHIIVVDADERIPTRLAESLRQIVEDGRDDFAAMRIPFRHHFAGHWMQCLYPGFIRSNT